MLDKESPKKVIVVGGGLVGALCAYHLAEKEFKVFLYENRLDIRKSRTARGRSINLALSNRGRKALRSVGLEEQVIKHAVPMKGRRIHFQNGKEESIPYDVYSDQCIYSVGRNFLNSYLLTALEGKNNVTLSFGCKLVEVNLKTDELTFFNTETKEYFQETGDLIIGADGAFSCLRRSLQTTPLFDCAQNYIDHGYIELRISPENGKLMKPNHLHIWPRGNLMLIALPNSDETWTLTLFMPFEKFKSINTKEHVLNFFQNNFSDVIHLVGEQELVEDFLKTKPSGLVSIKCSRFHYGDKYILLGDAAHAIVPFFGQGMNAGLEDCTILSQLLDKYSNDFAKVIKTFTEVRVKDAHAISDLAMYNYVEMRDLVTKPSYYLKKWFDQKLHKILHEKWQPLYYAVTFSHTPYSVCLKQKNDHDKIFLGVFIFMGVLIFQFMYSLLFK